MRSGQAAVGCAPAMAENASAAASTIKLKSFRDII